MRPLNNQSNLTSPYATGRPPAFWLIIPVKPFEEAKSRLAEMASTAERAAISQRLLRHVLQVTAEANVFAGRIVVSRSLQVLTMAEEMNATPLLEGPRQEELDMLNGALDQARTYAQEQGADAILVLPSDLPVLAVSDVHQITALGRRSDSVVIAASKDGGTNALLLHPSDAIDFAFGLQSCAQHQQLAERAGITPQILRTPSLALDIDSPADLSALMRLSP